MKATRLIGFMLGMAMVFVCAGSMQAQDKKYVGIAKVEGEPIDQWAEMYLDGEDADVTLGGVYNFLAGYTTTQSGNDISMTMNVPGSAKSVLKSSDDGGSFTGKMTVNGKTMQLWVLEVPMENVPVSMPTEEVAEIVGSPDGYTSFFLLKKDGGKICATSDFAFDKESGRWSVTCDSPSMQKIFSKGEGTYSVDGSKINLTDSKGIKVTGTIYNDGTYIEIPVGSTGGIDVTYILIR